MHKPYRPTLSPLAESALEQMAPEERAKFLDNLCRGVDEKTPEEAAEGPSGLIQLSKDELRAGA